MFSNMISLLERSCRDAIISTSDLISFPIIFSVLSSFSILRNYFFADFMIEIMTIIKIISEIASNYEIMRKRDIYKKSIINKLKSP